MTAQSISSEKGSHSLPDIRPDTSIIVVGAGVFGLSTALHLLQNGFTNVTILDAQTLDTNQYLPFNGADSASSDTRKVIRAAYGSAGHQTLLSMEAIEGWKTWNKEVLHPFFVNCGWARLNERGETLPVEVDNLKTMEQLGLRDSQYRLDDTTERERAVAQGWAKSKIDPFNRAARQLPLGGVFDSVAGYVRAADACSFVLEKVKSLGGKTVLGSAGDVVQLLYQPEESNRTEKRKVIGVKTTDSRDYLSDVVIIAAGPKTQSLIPSLNNTLAAVAGSILHIKVPSGQEERFKSDKFPVLAWNYTGLEESGSFSIFPIDEHGTLKFLYNGPKWRHAIKNKVDQTAQNDTTIDSTAPTSWSLEEGANVPQLVLDRIKGFISEHLPELEGAEIILAKLCWDSESIDKEFVIDWVPDVSGCLVVSGGSNHGFKFLPTLGSYVLKVLRAQDDEYTKRWKWRIPSDDELEAFKAGNVAPQRALRSKDLTCSRQDLKW